MKVFFHYCAQGFSNCYIVGSEFAATDTLSRDESSSEGQSGGRQAIIVDPGCMDTGILSLIESNDYQVAAVLVTHDHESHVHGLKTLKRIYNVPIYAADPTVCEQRATIVHDGDIITIGPFTVEVYSVPGHSSDSMAYRIDRLLFTGDTLTSGLIGSTQSDYGKSVQSTMIRSKLLSLPGNLTVLPGHGPPSTLEAERRFNAGLEEAEKTRKRRAALVKDFW